MKIDYQLLHPRRGWQNAGGWATFTPFYFKPARVFTLAEGEGLICLMVSLHGDRWMIYSLDSQGVPARSTIYEDRSVGEAMFRELCHQLTAEAKERLANSLSDSTRLTGRERAKAALELARLELADDDEHEDIRNTVRRELNGAR